MGHAGGTRIDLEHESIGAFDPGNQDGYDTGWHDLLHRFQALIDNGESYGVAGRNTRPASLGTDGRST